MILVFTLAIIFIYLVLGAQFESFIDPFIILLTVPLAIVGALCTLRGNRMYEFIEKLIFVVIPRQRDFRGLSLKSITDQGDLTIGFKEYTPFPEIKIEREKSLFGLEVTIQTTSEDKEQGLELFRLMGFPIK